MNPASHKRPAPTRAPLQGATIDRRISFSIIIPTYRRPEQIGRCLESIARLDYPRDRFELLVVDDGSPKPPHEVIESFRHKLNAMLLTPKHGGPAAARNAGAMRAKGTYLAFTDDDCAPATDWLKTLAGHADRYSNCLFGGHTINALPENPYSRASQMSTDYLYSYFLGRGDAGAFARSAVLMRAS
jgi:glycosyltransferase involved in cell wall biosynthesis